jgi:hypothetical protein
VVKDSKGVMLGYSHTPRILYSHREFLASAMLNVHNVNEGGPIAFDGNCVMESIIIIIIIIITAIEFSLGGCPYASTGKTNTNKYT